MFGLNKKNNSNKEKSNEPPIDNLKKLSALLFLYNEPITISKVKEFLKEENLNKKEIENLLKDLEEKLKDVGLTIVKKEKKDEEKTEITISVLSELGEIAKKVRMEELEGDLTAASLQVLTICAYLGPISKSEISFIRGVQSSQSIRSLSSRGLITKENEKYSISIEAMQKLGLNNISDLPEYEKIKADFEEKLKDALHEE
ncbi:MAG: segregation and condensation protein [Patescibacteria group bacterium]|nr:segregation and condensation protein [Patescibacteria group bacterium]